MNVLFINMPFASAWRPSIGVGLLKSALTEIGISATVENLNVLFSRAIGSEAYDYLAESAPPELLAGDFVFAHCLFGPAGFARDDYIRLLERAVPPPDVAEVQHHVALARSAATPFLEDAWRSIDWNSYDIVGFTTTFCQNVASLALARRLKQNFPRLTIIFGGANCEGTMGLQLHRSFPFVDIVCTGEADKSFPDVVAALSSGRDPSEIPGVLTRSGSETSCRTLDPVRVRDLDELPIPDYDEFFSLTKGDNHAALVMETSRGCWWGDKHHCLFCGIDFPEQYRAKSWRRALSEIEYLSSRYHTADVVMVDAILSMGYFTHFLPALRDSPNDLSIFYETKANLSKEQLALLYDAGVKFLQPGIESFSSRVLRLMDKGTTAIQNVQLLKWAAEIGIVCGWNLIYGFPGETAEDFREIERLLPALQHLQPPQSCSRIRLDRFSPYFVAPANYGIENVRPVEAYSLIYDLPAQDLRGLAYFFDYEYADSWNPEQYAERIKEQTRTWSVAAPAAKLSYLDNGDVLSIHRSTKGSQEIIELDGWARDIYLYCDAQRSGASIEEYCASTGRSARATNALLDELVSRQLMIAVEGRYLSLAIRKRSNVTVRLSRSAQALRAAMNANASDDTLDGDCRFE